MLLEGPMIIIACSALAICHPGASFQGHWHDANFVFWEKLTLRSHKKSQSDVIGLGSIDEESRTHTSHGNVVMSAEGK